MFIEICIEIFRYMLAIHFLTCVLIYVSYVSLFLIDISTYSSIYCVSVSNRKKTYFLSKNHEKHTCILYVYIYIYV